MKTPGNHPEQEFRINFITDAIIVKSGWGNMTPFNEDELLWQRHVYIHGKLCAGQNHQKLITNN